MSNEFFSPEGDIENYFVTDYWLIDQYIGDQLWTWGSGTYGKLGNATTTGTTSTPVTTFSGGTNWKQVVTGYRHSAAIKTDGTLWTWGSGTYGRLGTNDSTNRSTPVTTFLGGTNWKQVSCAQFHTAAVKTDGTLWTWGFSSEGRLGTLDALSFRVTPVTTFAGGTNWADTATGAEDELYTLSAGGSHTAAIKTDGTLWTWGNGSNGRLGNNSITSIPTPVTTFSGGTNWKQVIAGNAHTAAIKTDGTLWTWGSGSFGVLGNNSVSQVSTPVTTFSGGTNWKQVSATLNGSHTVAVKTDGTLWTWGYGGNGRLGNAVITTNRSTPVTTFSGGTNWKQVSAGTGHTAAIKTDGTLWTWGYGGQGRLGNAATAGNISTPVTTFSGGTNWKQVACGFNHTSAIKTDGTLWTWGFNSSGQLGNATTTGTTSTPVTTFSGGTNWKQVSCGDSHTTAVKTDGTLWTWGFSAYGRLGTNDITPNRSTPVTTFTGGTNWKQVNAGYRHTVALRDDGVNKELYIFGSNSAVQLGTNYNSLAQFNIGGTDWKQVTCGVNYNAAIKTDGTLWTWGNGSEGRLGNASLTGVLTPVTTFAGGNNWKQVSSSTSSSASTAHTAAIKTDGTLWTWGACSVGQLGTNNTTPNRSTPVTTFAGGTNWKQVTVGATYTAAIKTDGTLWTWGNGGSGQLGRLSFGSLDATIRATPVTTFAGGTNWADTATGAEDELYTLSAGDRHTAAIKTDGTLWTWGNGGNGVLGDNTETNRSTPVTTFAGGTNWKQVSCGRFHTAAIKTDGTLWTWGSGSLGRLGTNDATNRSTPVTTFSGGTNWKQVSSGGSHTAAIKTDGTLWIWGNGLTGRLGHAQTTIRSTPVTTFLGGTNWKQVSAGTDHTAAIKTDGTLWTWGNRSNGKLGNGITSITGNTSTPVTTFSGGTNWKQVSCGSNYTSATKTDGTLWTWGNGTNGQLGNAAVATNISTPVTTFSGGTNWKQVSCGFDYTSAIKTDGTLWIWGSNSFGQLGNNSTTNTSTPITTFAGGTNWKQVSAGYRHTISLRDNGVNKELYIFGNNALGQLGIPQEGSINWFPNQTIAGGTNWKQASAGVVHTAAIKTDGTLWTWGEASLGRLGNGLTTGTRTNAVTVFAGGTNWKQVSTGFDHTLAVESGISAEYPLS
jgi:alpha-tubulin suppressor-like RCC1 family protein